MMDIEKPSFNSVLVKNKQENKEGLYLFFSFDLVNATEFKLRNKKWTDTFINFYRAISKNILDNEKSPLRNSRVWKYIGDEILFFLKVTDPHELYDALPYIYSTVGLIEDTLTDKSSFYDRLFVKSTVWIAKVKDNDLTDNESSNSPSQKDYLNNITFTPSTHNSYNQEKRQDFLGHEIDLGFRISTYSHHGKITVGAKLALFLWQYYNEEKCNLNSQQKWDVEEKLKIVTYTKLKGIWRDHWYPIIWYDETWNPEKMFHYDEHLKSGPYKEYKRVIESEETEPISKLPRIFRDVNLNENLTSLKEIIEKSCQHTYQEDNPPANRAAEVHVSVICLNKGGDKLLVLHRVKNKSRFPDTWEFGCGQIRFDETFEEAGKRIFDEDFDVSIVIQKKQPIINIYSFVAEDTKKKIPGILLLGQMDEKGSLKIDNAKHDEYRWISREELSNFCSNNKVVDNFQSNATLAFERHCTNQD